MSATSDRLEPIELEECLRLLADAELGRLAFVVDGQPRIAPVNYRLIDGAVVFVSRPGSKLDAARRGDRVAFEIDSSEEWAHAGWSVLVLGVATTVTDPAEIAHLAAQVPLPWAPTPDHTVIRIVPGEVTGRRVRVSGGEVTILEQESDGESDGFQPSDDFQPTDDR